MNIRNLFDPTKDIYRTIEKVISYGASQENRLKAEISEYVVTESIEEQMRKLLDNMQLAMESGGENEVGVWVSGFYGSGKSSFTKYLGLSFDGSIVVDGVPFLKRLQDRLNTPQVKAQLATVAQRFPAAVVMLDLASEMLAGATMEDVSTVLYFKVLQWAGYSRNLKVAALERRVKKDGRWEEFLGKATLPGMTWEDLQNDPLVVDDLVPRVAHEMYPQLFSSPNSFTSSTDGFLQSEDQRVREMLDVVREKSGREHVIFIVDEVGQYVASRDNLILNLDGLAKNLKRLGNGKAWVIATAQQTLTEDDPRAVLNSEKLYKLKDRFPVLVELESSDIKEICYRRLLGKSPEGEASLGKYFDTHGQELRHNTRLQDARYYDSDFSRETFVKLYPFLPAHFDILLHLLGALAKSTGGVGLRSAIKVIQDILVEGTDGRSPVADQPVGWLATTVTLYDALERDIRRAFLSIHQAVNNTFIRFPDSDIHREVAKSIAVLQILGNMPVTVRNLASLMHPSVEHASRLEEVGKAVEEMLKDPYVPLGEKDGRLAFLSERLREIEEERGRIIIRTVEARRIFNESLREAFDPLPKTTLHSTLAVASGLKLQSGSSVTGLAGEREPIQTVVKLVDATQYEAERTRLVEESRENSNGNTIFLLGRTSAEVEGLISEVYRCQEIVARYGKEPDQEVRDYCSAQAGRAETLRRAELIPKIKQSLGRGSFVFRGEATAVAALEQEVLESAKRVLAKVAGQVFERYAEAPVRVETGIAERFLRLNNLAGVTGAVDPLGLVEVVGGTPAIKTSHRAITSIRDYVDRNGAVEGKRLLEHFSHPPFGWSQDTVRYILAAMLMAGEIKLKVSGREVTAAGQQAIDALKTNKSFGAVGVSLRDERPSMETLARAAKRLTELIGDTVFPLEQELSKAAVKHFPRLQQEYGPLSEKLSTLGVNGAERVQNLTQDIADILFTDASDAPQRLGGEESALYDDLKWAGEVRLALGKGLEETIRQLQTHRREVGLLPDTGVPGDLRRELTEDLGRLAERLKSDDFFRHAADLNSLLTDIKARVRDAAVRLGDKQKSRLKDGADDLRRLSEWSELTQEEQASVLGELDGLAAKAPHDLAGFKQLLGKDYDIGNAVAELREQIIRKGRERRLGRAEEERANASGPAPAMLKRSIAVPSRITTETQLDELLGRLREVKEQVSYYPELEVSITVTE
jgi:hypothetical protein